MATEPLELVLGAKLTTFLADLTKGAKAIDDFANRLARAKRTILADLEGIERSLKAMPAAVQGLAAAASTIRNFSSETQGAAREADLALRELGATAIDTARAVNEGFSEAADAADRAGGRIGNAAGRARNAAGDLGGAGQQARSGLERAFGAMEDTVNGAGRRIKGVLTDVRTALAAIGGIALGNEIVDTTAAFEDALGQLAIVADDTGVPIDTFRQKLVALAETTPQDLVGLTNALGTAIGSLPKGANQAADGFGALVAAQNAARASGATTEETLAGIAAILNTYGKTGITAAQVSDKLFAAFDQGAATVPEIAGSIGQIAGIASTFNISIDEVLGSIAVLTRGGQSASEAISNLRQAYVTVSSEQKNITDRAKQLGIEFDTNALRTKGLIGVLEDLQQKGGEPFLRQLFTDTQGFLGASTLLSAGLDQVRDDIERVGNSTGKTDAALAKIADNFSQTAGIAKNQLTTTLVEIGERIMPKVQKVIEDVGNFLADNKEEIAAGFEKLFDVLTSLGGWVIDHGPEILTVLAGFGIGNVLAGAAEAANSFAEELDNIAGAAGDAADEAGDLGDDLSEEFGESFGGKIAKQIGKALKYASVAAEVIAASIAIGTAIGNAIGDSLNITERLRQQLIQARNDQLDAQMLERARAAGYETVEAFKEAQRQLAAGEAVEIDGVITKVTEAVSGGRKEAVEQAVAATEQKIAELSDRAEQLNAEAAAARARRDTIEAQFKSGYRTQSNAAGATEIFAAVATGNPADAVLAAKRKDPSLEAADRQVRNLEADARAAAEALLAADAQRQGLEASLAAAEAKPDAKPKGKATKNLSSSADRKAAKEAAAEARRIAEDLAKAQADLAASQAQADQEALAALERKTDAAIRATEKEAIATSEYAAKVSGSQEEITAAWDTAGKRITTLVEQQIETVKRAGDAEIQVARVAADEKIRQYAGSVEAQKVAAQQFAEEEVRIQQSVADRIEQIRSRQAARVLELDERRLNAIIAAARLRAARTPTPDLAATAAGGELTRANRIGASPGAALGAGIGTALGGAAGAVAGAEIATSLTQLPQTLAALATFLRTGIADFVQALGDAAGEFLLALVEGLPEQIDRLINVVIPRLIEGMVLGLPRLVQGIALLAPKIVVALLRPLTGELAKSIAVAVGEAFATAGVALYNGLKAAFEKIIEYIKKALKAAADYATGGFLEDIPVVGGGVAVLRSGARTLYNSTLGKLFHSGGVIRGPGSVGAAAQMAMAGAPQFAFGGVVPRVGAGAQRAIQRALAGDDVPAILQAGEGVLSRMGMAALGGEPALAALNRGQTQGLPTALQVVIEARDGADRVLAQHAIRSVSASVRSPTGGVRQAIDQTRAPGPPLMQRYVKR